MSKSNKKFSKKTAQIPSMPSIVFIPHGDHNKPIAALCYGYLRSIVDNSCVHVMFLDRRAPDSDTGSGVPALGGVFHRAVNIGIPPHTFRLHAKLVSTARTYTFRTDERLDTRSDIAAAVRFVMRSVDDMLSGILRDEYNVPHGLVPSFIDWMTLGMPGGLSGGMGEESSGSIVNDYFIRSACVLAAEVFTTPELENCTTFLADYTDFLTGNESSGEGLLDEDRTMAAGLLAAVTEANVGFLGRVRSAMKKYKTANFERPADAQSVREKLCEELFGIIDSGDALRRVISDRVLAGLSSQCVDGGPGNFVVLFDPCTSPVFIRALKRSYPGRLGFAVASVCPTQILGQLHMENKEVFDAVLKTFRDDAEKTGVRYSSDPRELVITWTVPGVGTAFQPQFLLHGFSGDFRNPKAFTFRPSGVAGGDKA